METRAGPAAAKRALGRPRRLTLDKIVDVACEIGIADFDMALVAERLQTGVATLYNYVRGREHLLQLVTERLARRVPVEDVGQSWQTVLRDHAAFAFTMFNVDPTLIATIGQTTPDAQEDSYARNIVGMLVARGIPLAAAVDLYVEVSQVVVGAAVCLVRRRRLEPRAEGAAPLPDMYGDYRPTLDLIICQRAAELATTAPVSPSSR